MALHPVSLPPQAARLFRVVVLLKRLFMALADPKLDAACVNTLWVQEVWSELDLEWVRRFCLGGQEARISSIASASIAARRALFDEFCRQNKVRGVFQAGGDFRSLDALSGLNPELVEQVKAFLLTCYDKLGHNTNSRWPGFQFTGNRAISKSSYQSDFCAQPPTSDVCPYCDCDISAPVLDHYLPKSRFPLLSCSPWNLVPVCEACNKKGTGKGDKLPITEGTPNSMATWLHPFFRPASPNVTIRLSGSPRDSIPRLHSPDPDEQVGLDNHFDLVQTQTGMLTDRWTKRVASYYEKLVRDVRRERSTNHNLDDIVRVQLAAHLEDRGKVALAIIRAAVCQAVLDRRPEYLEEFDDPNQVGLV